jgi:hypothetical protein
MTAKRSKLAPDIFICKYKMVKKRTPTLDNYAYYNAEACDDLESPNVEEVPDTPLAAINFSALK